jgi:hypothetical protein
MASHHKEKNHARPIRVSARGRQYGSTELWVKNVKRDYQNRVIRHRAAMGLDAHGGFCGSHSRAGGIWPRTTKSANSRSSVRNSTRVARVVCAIYVLLEGCSAVNSFGAPFLGAATSTAHPLLRQRHVSLPNLARAPPTNLRVGRHTATILGCHRQPKKSVSLLSRVVTGSATVMTVEIKRCFF